MPAGHEDWKGGVLTVTGTRGHHFTGLLISAWSAQRLRSIRARQSPTQELSAQSPTPQWL